MDAMLAPGFLVRSAGTSTPSSYVYLTGTSMATPHVTGAVAVLKAKLPSATADQILTAMQISGIATSGIGWTWTTPRLDVNAAVDALGQKPAPAGVPIVSLFSGSNPSANTYLRLMNNDSATGHATITIIQNDSPATTLGTYSITVPKNAALQISMAEIEAAIKYPGSTGATLEAYVKTDFKGYMQNVLWNTGVQALTNITTCGSTTADDKTFLGSVHTSVLADQYPGRIFIQNTGSADMKATLDVYDAKTGSSLGSATTASAIPSYTSGSIDILAWLDFINFRPTPSQPHVVFKLRSGFTGFLQYLVFNPSKVITDMTQKCAF